MQYVPHPYFTETGACFLHVDAGLADALHQPRSRMARDTMQTVLVLFDK